MIADTLHFSFTVSDIERSVKWYTQTLGLELVHRQRQENAYTQRLVGIPGAVLEVAQLKIPGLSPKYSTHMLELIEYVAEKGDSPASLPTNQVGVAHLALFVTDIHDRYEQMVNQGVVFCNAPVEITAGANKGGWACYLHDPDGITLELLQFADERMTSLGLDRPRVTAQEYLVKITVGLPAEMSTERRADLLAAERRRGRELRSQGAIRRIWRIPGQHSNVGIWSAGSAAELHEMITSLPLHPWMMVEVGALASHPLEADAT